MSSSTLPLDDYRAITAAVGMLDRSDRGKLALTGADAKTFLQGQVSNDVEALTPGAGCYATFLTPKGKMLGDLRILDTGAELTLDTERVALQGLFNLIRRFSLGFEVQLHKRTLQRGLISLIGPDAARVAGVTDLPAAEHAHRDAELARVPLRAIRTDVGIDLLCDAADTEHLISGLAGMGVPTIGEAAAECLRVERGRPRYGVDLDDSVIPQEADLNPRAVSFTKGCYVGQETVARLFYRGKPNRRLRGIRLSAPVPTGAEISFAGRSVGTLGTVADSPGLGAVALAIVRREAPPGSPVHVGPEAVPAVVVELPFVPDAPDQAAV